MLVLLFPLEKKCNLCKQSYRQERYTIIKKKKLDAKISLRSDNKNKSKYVDILCLECKSKVFCKKELCKECLKAYGALLKRNYRQKLKTREKENQKDNINTDLRGVSKVESNTECRIQTDGNLKSMCEVKNEDNDRKTLKAKKGEITIRKKNTKIGSFS